MKKKILKSNTLENLYPVGPASKLIGVSPSYLRKHTPEFKRVGLIKNERIRISDGARLYYESDVIRMRDYLSIEVPNIN